MADNFLERKFEEYQSKKGATTKKVVSSAPKPGTFNVKFPARRVFVTGGANGIGKAIVAKFREVGCRVAFCDLDEKAGQATAEATGSQFYPVDVADADALDKCVQTILSKWEDVDILVNNVGISEFKPIEECSVCDFDNVYSVNLRPVFVASRRLALHRKEKGIDAYGRIINISSTRRLMSEPNSEAYAATKGGIHSLTHALAASLSKYGFTVNSISPGWIECGDYEALRDIDHSQHFSKRVGRPTDIASACLYLSMPESDFINGEDIVVDGGMTKKMIYQE